MIKRLSAILLLAALILSLSSCNKGTVTEIFEGSFDEALTAEHNADAYLDFSLRLVKSAASERGKNAAVSPYSVISGLAVLANAAKGENLAQIEKSSGYTKNGLSSEVLYLKDLSGRENGSVIKSSDYVFVKDGTGVNENAVTAGARVFSATPGKNTVKYINGVCSEDTNGSVKKATESFDNEELMILNTFLFDCAWNEIYEDKDVKTRNFKNYDGTETEVKILCSKENIITSDEFIGFSKMYKGEKYCFTAFMPKDEEVDIYDFLESIDAEKWKSIYGSRRGVMVAVRFPEFSIDCGSGTERVLKDLGITDVFDGGKADLSGVFTNGSVCSSFIQGTRVEINRKGTGRSENDLFKERGTEALPEYDLIFLDRPFVFAVTDERTLSPVYIGVVADMSGAVQK